MAPSAFNYNSSSLPARFVEYLLSGGGSACGLVGGSSSSSVEAFFSELRVITLKIQNILI